MRKLILLVCVFALPLLAQEETVVLRVAGMDEIDVRKNVRYGAEHVFDLYRPPNTNAALPLVVFINGVGIPGIKDWGQYTSWPRLVATRGFAAVTYETSRDANAKDTDALFRFLREHANELKIDASRMAIWACSANARLGTQLLAASDAYRAAVFYYGAMDTAPKNITTPVYVTRAGLDSLTLNRSIDRWVTQAIAIEVPVTVVTYPEARHAFELLDDTAESRAIVEQTLDFLAFHLTTAPTPRKQPMTLAQLQQMIESDGLQRAIARLEELRKSHPATFVLQEGSLNGIGYALLADRKVADAIAILELVVKLNADSANAHDSLGDAYEAAGRAAEAIAESERALALLEKVSPARREGIRRSAEEKLARLKK